MANRTHDDEPPEPFSSIADKNVAKQRLARRPDYWEPVRKVFEDADPDAKFIAFARSYIVNAGKDVRTVDINDLVWFFGIKDEDRPKLKKLLRWKGIVGGKD